MYTSTPNIGFHSDPPPAQSGQGQPIQMSTTTDPLPCQNIIFGAYCRGCKLYKVCVGVNGDIPVIPGCCPYIVLYSSQQKFLDMIVQ
jgi:hypothetical protein